MLARVICGGTDQTVKSTPKTGLGLVVDDGGGAGDKVPGGRCTGPTQCRMVCGEKNAAYVLVRTSNHGGAKRRVQC